MVVYGLVADFQEGESGKGQRTYFSLAYCCTTKIPFLDGGKYNGKDEKASPFYLFLISFFS